MPAMGVHIRESHLPICNKFTTEILNDQLCYTVDLDKYKNEEYFQEQLNLGLVFLMDYNEDRQVTLNESQGNINVANLVNNIDESNDDKYALIYLKNCPPPFATTPMLDSAFPSQNLHYLILKTAPPAYACPLMLDPRSLEM